MHYLAQREIAGLLTWAIVIGLTSAGLAASPAPVEGAADRSVGSPAPDNRTRALDVADFDRERILRLADQALDMAPVAVTQSRARLSEGGPHDFYSNGDYWWPDPNKPDGLPYIQRDGQSNPDNFSAHRMALRNMRDAVAALAAAYAVGGQETYAQKAVTLLKVFFLDEETRMNPSLLYAQAIPGRFSGRGIGIIDTLHLAEVAMAIVRIENAAAMTPEMRSGLKQWFADYAEWMTTHKYGLDEMSAKNNHSVAYMVQLAAFATLTGDTQKLDLCRTRYKEVFVPQQMAADGSFPQELRRTKPYGYSIFQLDNMAILCQLLSTPEDNLWTFTLPDGRGIRKAVEYLYPYLQDKSRWPHRHDVEHFENWPVRQPALLFAGCAFGEKKYLDLWKKLDADPIDQEVRRNMAITQPLLWFSGIPQERRAASPYSQPDSLLCCSPHHHASIHALITRSLEKSPRQTSARGCHSLMCFLFRRSQACPFGGM